jgi:diguanylate cyclase (GGDEF)-like protein/PAS domain S-box-containing protein
MQFLIDAVTAPIKPFCRKTMPQPPENQPACLLFLARMVGVCLLSLLALVSPCQAQEQTASASIRVVLDDNYPPYIFRDSEGKLQGILRDTWDLWSKKTGIAVQLDGMDWGKAQKEMEAGHADVIDTIFETEKRLKIYDFSRPYATIEVPIFFDKEIGGISGIETLRGFTIGVKDGDACVERLVAGGIKNLKSYPSYEMLVTAAANKDVRVFCIDKPPAMYFLYQRNLGGEFRHTAPLYSGQFHWAVSKGNIPLRATLATGFSKISEAERQAIETRWLGSPLNQPQNFKYAKQFAYALLLVGGLACALTLWTWALRRRVKAKTAELTSTLNALREAKELYSKVLQTSPDGICVADVQGNITFASQRVLEILGVAQLEEIIGRNGLELVSPEYHEAFTTNLERILRGAAPRDNRYLLIRKSGLKFYGELTSSCLYDAAGNPSGLVSIIRDVSERKRAEEALRASQAHMEALVTTTPVGVFETRADGYCIFVNERWQEMSSQSLVDAQGDAWLGAIHGDERETVRNAWQLAVRDHVALQMEFRFLRPDGASTWVLLQTTPVLDSQGEVSGHIGSATDITERKAAEAQIEFLAHHDPLTGLPNRLLLKDRVEQTIVHAGRTTGKAALLYLDLDNFKTINDSLGHPVGDALLQEVAKRLLSCVRDTDTISRQGGDEFVVVLTDVADTETISATAAKILQQLVRPVLLDRHELSTSISIGIAVYPDDAQDFNALLQKADTAMYHAKEAGRNTYRFFNEQMNLDAVDHLLMRNSLSRGLQQREFVLHYQPQINLATGAIIGAEALIRWQHPERGLIPPMRFIPIAESTGLIVPIGEWVLNEACRQAVAWRQAGLPELVMAVNLSAVQFKRDDLEQSVVAALSSSGLDPALLELELTESILIHNTEKVFATVRRLKSLGVKFSIDDFGTGYSSLAYLKRFDVDKLKIDQSFIRDLADDPGDAAIVRAIIQMARSLNLKTIAEGVEDASMLSYLRLNHCDEAQGYLFGRPMPAEEFAAFLADADRTVTM